MLTTRFEQKQDVYSTHATKFLNGIGCLRHIPQAADHASRRLAAATHTITAGRLACRRYTAISTVRVLLIEDNVSDARIVERVLRRYPLADFEIEVAGSTTECAERISNAPPDIILLDNGLPGESGISFLRRTQAQEDKPPVIMLTGQSDDRLALEAIRLGAHDYYPKDALASETLGRAVHSAIERFRLDTELRRRNEILRQSEERYRSLVELSPDAYFLYCDRKIVFTNSAGLRLLSATGADEIVQGQLRERIRVEDEEALAGVLQQVRQGEAVPFFDCKFVKADGAEIDIEVAAVPTTYEGKQAVQIVVRDITERKHAEEMTRRALAAEESEQQKVVLLSAVSHELRTPIAAIQGYATTMLDYGDRLEESDVTEYLRGITGAAQALEKLVADLLTLSRLEAGALPLHPKMMTVRALVEDVLATYRTLAPNRKIDVDLSPEEIFVNVDPHRIRQVLNNLLDNALKYSPASRAIRLSAESSEAGTTIKVRDHGPGVALEELETIFEPFQRGKNAATTEVKGTGLGLAICRAIVEAHGGKIWAVLPAQGGLELTLLLPGTQAPASTAEAA